jgi:alkane 1-monooxygenase
MIFSWGIFFKILKMFSTMELNFDNISFIIGFGFIASNYYTAQFTVSHELMHKPGFFYRVLGTLHLIKFYYMHFTYHHLYRHHVWVGTPKDPSTAKKGENIYLFILRSIIYSWKGAYDDEKALGKTVWTNYANLSLLGSIFMASGIYYFYGMQALVIHSLMVFGALVYLEAINYVEHYGLARKLLPNG